MFIHQCTCNKGQSMICDFTAQSMAFLHPNIHPKAKNGQPLKVHTVGRDIFAVIKNSIKNHGNR